MSLGDSGTGGAASGMAGGGGGGSGGGGSLHHHKKLRRKRKELDALVSEEKVRRKTSTSRQDLLRNSDSDDIEFSGGSNDSGFLFGRGGLLGCLPGVCALLVLLTTAVGVAAALRLLMTTRKDLDALQMRLNAVEASGSELPAKFHESHVRLQQLEKNHTSLWTALTSVSSEVTDLTQKMKTLETSLKALEDRLSGTPKLSSLPKNVADVEASVATFGSSLQDVQSALKSLKEGHDTLQKSMKSNKDSVQSLKNDVLQLKNDTHLPPVRGREGASESERESVVSAIVSLRKDVVDLTSSVSTVNASVTSSTNGRQTDAERVQRFESFFNESLGNLTHQVTLLELVCNKLESENLPNQVANLSLDLFNLKQMSVQQHSEMWNLNQSIAVVKGVEKKLEGSQVQMASGVSELKQQIQKLEKDFESFKPPPAISSSEKLTDSQKRGRNSRSISQDPVNYSSEILQT